MVHFYLKEYFNVTCIWYTGWYSIIEQWKSHTGRDIKYINFFFKDFMYRYMCMGQQQRATRVAVLKDTSNTFLLSAINKCTPHINE